MSQSQWQRIAEFFRERIVSGELAPGQRLPSDAALAAEWGVSRPTAHRALHELQRSGLVLRSKRNGTVVMESVAKATGKIAFLVDRFAHVVNFPQTDLIRGVHEVFGEDVRVVMTQSDSDPGREARQLMELEHEVDGVLLYPTSDPSNNDLIQSMFDRGYPLVVLDRFPPGLSVDTVATDNEDAARQAVHHLQQLGHSRIAFLSFHKPGFSSVHERYLGYTAAVGALGLDDTGQWVRWLPAAWDSEPELLFQATLDAVHSLVSRDGVTAAFCVEDSVAANVISACERMGIALPDQFEIATFNDWPPVLLRQHWQLHRLVQNAYQIGKSAAQLLSDRIARNGSSQPDGSCRTVRVPAHFVPGSLAPRRNGLAAYEVPASTNGGS
jgi:DNA-binding LacI/PurR family transcriptional regulator